MRNPDNMGEVFVNDTTLISMDEVPECITEDYDLFDDKEFKKYIADCKSICRGSREYKKMIAFLKENMDMRKCSFFENVGSYGLGSKVKIEIHHTPYTIEDIIRIVIKKRMAFRESVEIELTAKEVMYLHYNLMVGLIPLCETVHDLVHNNYIFVPNDKVFGKFREFTNLYYDFIDPEVLDDFDKTEEMTNTCNNDNHNILLARNYIYIDLHGEYKLPKLQDVKDLLKGSIDRVRSENEKQIKVIHPIIHLK